MLGKRALVASLAAAATAVATAGTPAFANVQVGASGWQWGNPLPQGNTLRSASFAGTTGYAAGDFGTLLKTTDGGATWSGLPVGTFQNLSVVQALDANTVFAGGGCVARRSTDGGRTFTSIAFTPVEATCPASLTALSFVSPTLGYLLLSDGSVFTTDDGGTQFAQRTALPGTSAAGGAAQPTSLVFTSATTGVGATGDGRVFRTTDAGVSWRVVGEFGFGLRQLWFADADHGFAVGTGGNFLRTSDGGSTWTRADLGAGPLDYSGIRCADTQLCILSTVGGAQLVRTTDAGATAAAAITPSTSAVYTAAFASPTRVVALGASGTTVVSDDAGSTFTPVGGRLDARLGALRAGATRGTAFALGGPGVLARTTDGGRSWSRGSVPTSSVVTDVSFPTADVGYALDATGGLFRTANGGRTWKTLGAGTTARVNAVLAPSADVVLTAGVRGLRRSADGGGTFAPIGGRGAPRATLTALAQRGGAIVASGARTIVASRDGGRSWRAVPRPGQRRDGGGGVSVRQVAFVSATTGWLLDDRGGVWRTTDGGRRWTALDAVGTRAVTGLAASSARAAYLVLERFGGNGGGYLLRTADAGATWQPQFVIADAIAAGGVVAPPGGIDYLLGSRSQLLSTTTGGSVGAPSRLTLSTRRRRLSKPGRVTVSGRLSPAGRSARVVVSALIGRSWSSQTADVAANGAFVTAWRVPRGTTRFVAQWTGDFSAAGAGSRVLDVTVGKSAKRSPRRAPRGGRKRGGGRRR